MTIYNFIFTKQTPGKYYRHISFWVAQYIFWTFWTTGIFIGLAELLKFGLRLNGAFVLHAAYTYLIVYYFSPKYLETKRYKRFIFLVSVVTLFTYILYVFYLILIFYGYNNYFKDLRQGSNQTLLMAWYFSMNFIINGPPPVCAMFLTCKMIKNYYIKMEEKQMLIKENANAEMQLLKAQVHPHFLFNTLNNIYAFALNKSAVAGELVLKLKDTTKYMVYECETALVPLHKEIKMLNDYIELEKVRYGVRLNIEVNIGGDYDDRMITPLLMIPFIENAFKHGTSKMLINPWIKLNIEANEDLLYFSLVNGKPFSDINVNGKEGIGLNNVKKRLELLYPQNHLLLIESTENTFTVNMQIPIYKIQEKSVA